jgi:hypothetical protein
MMRDCRFPMAMKRTYSCQATRRCGLLNELDERTKIRFI